MKLKTAFLPAFLMASTATFAQETGPIVIHVAAPFTGNGASNGADMKAAALVAAKKINEEGGIMGRTLEIRVEDDAGEPKQARSVANRIVGNAGKLVIGHYSSDETKAAIDVYNENNLLLITPSQRPDLLQQNYDRTFRITPNALELAKGYMDVVEKEYRAGSNAIGILANKGSLAQFLSESLKKQLDSRSLPVSFKENYTQDERDYASILDRMRAQKISIILLTGSEKEMGLIVRQAAEKNYKPKFILSSTAASAGFAQTAGCDAENVHVIAAWNPLYTLDYLPLLKQLRQGGVNGIDIAINIYSAVLAIAKGIESAETTDPALVARALHAGTYDLPIGFIQFTTSGELSAPRAITYKYQCVDRERHIAAMLPVIR